MTQRRLLAATTSLLSIDHPITDGPAYRTWKLLGVVAMGLRDVAQGITSGRPSPSIEEPGARRFLRSRGRMEADPSEREAAV